MISLIIYHNVIFRLDMLQEKNNVEADYLSKNSLLEPDENEGEQFKIVNSMELTDILKDQKENPYIKGKKCINRGKHSVLQRSFKRRINLFFIHKIIRFYGVIYE